MRLVRVRGDSPAAHIRAERAARGRASARTAGCEQRALTPGLLVPFAWAAGCVDAVSYLLFGGVFTANMTGNTVLLGLAIGRLHWHDAALSGLALVGFSLGALAGSAARTARVAFTLEGIALGVAAIFGGLSEHPPAIVAAALAMGIQTASLRSRNRTGVKVTYLTGTLTTFWARLATPGDERHRAGFPAVVWLAYGAGAVGGGLLTSAWGAATLLLPISVACVAAVVKTVPGAVSRSG